MHILSMFAGWEKYDVAWVGIILAVVILAARIKQAPSGFWQNFWDHFPVIMLFLLFVISLMVVIHMLHDKADAASMQWAQGLVTGVINMIAISLKVNNPGNGNGGPPKDEPPKPIDNKTLPMAGKP